MPSEDYLIYHKWKNYIDVMQTTILQLDQYTLDETKNYIEANSSQSKAKGYLIEVKKTNKIIGIMSLINIDYKNSCAECILDISEKTILGKRFGTSALSLILDFAFNELSLHRLSWQVFSFNKKQLVFMKNYGLHMREEFEKEFIDLVNDMTLS